MGKKQQRSKSAKKSKDSQPQLQSKSQPKLSKRGSLIEKVGILEKALANAINENQQLKGRVQELQALLVQTGEILRKQRSQKDDSELESEVLTLKPASPKTNKQVDP